MQPEPPPSARAAPPSAAAFRPEQASERPAAGEGEHSLGSDLLWGDALSSSQSDSPALPRATSGHHTRPDGHARRAGQEGEEEEEAEETPILAPVPMDVERLVVRGALGRVFNATMSDALLRTFYPPGETRPQFQQDSLGALRADEGVQSPPAFQRHGQQSSGTGANHHQQQRPQQQPQPPLPPPVSGPPLACCCRFQASGFSPVHFVQTPFPAFTLTVVQSNGQAVPRQVVAGRVAPLQDLRVELSVHNRWAEVTSEVLANPNPEYALVDGSVSVDGLVFLDVSLKHGGFFTMHARVVANDNPGFAVEDWHSDKFVIQSVKSHSNLKRKVKQQRSNDGGRRPRARKPRRGEAPQSPQMQPQPQSQPQPQPQPQPQQQQQPQPQSQPPALFAFHTPLQPGEGGEDNSDQPQQPQPEEEGLFPGWPPF